MIRNFKFNKNPSISGLYTVQTSNIYKSIWAYLGRFKSKIYVKDTLNNQIIKNKNLIEKKSEDISYLIKQSEEFFNSSLTASISIKPLIIYYGILGLAKALIISGDNNFTLEKFIDKNHGLSVKPIDDNEKEKKARFSNSLIEEFCYIKRDGIYPLFRSCYCENKISHNTKISFKMLLSLIGENWQKYFDFFKECPNVLECWKPVNGGVKTLNDSKQLFNIDKLINNYYLSFFKKNKETQEEALFRIFPNLNNNYQKYGESSYITKNDVFSLDYVIYVTETEDQKFFAFIQPFSEFNLTDFDVYFLIFFILSNLCRYYQDKWFKIINYIDHYEFFLIENIFEIAQYKFPLLILRELENKDFVFIKNTNF